MKLFGFNILTDEELYEIKHDLKNVVQELFDQKKMYIVEKTSELKPKCNFCNSERQVEVDFPDGTKQKVMCSCYEYVEKINILEVEDIEFWKYKDKEIYLVFEDIRRFDCDKNQEKILLTDKESLDKVMQNIFYNGFYRYAFATKELAEQAVSRIKRLKAKETPIKLEL